MAISISPDLEKALATVPREEIEGVLLRLAEQHGHDKEKALTDALQKGLDDIEAGRVTRISTKEEMDELFAASRKRVLNKVLGDA